MNPYSKKAVAYAYRELLEALRDHTTIRNVSTCFPYKFGFTWPVLASQRFATGQYRLYKCSNTNACVVCAGKHASNIQHQFRQTLESCVRGGSTVWLMTLDLGFGEGIPGRQRYRVLSRLFGQVLNQSPVKTMRRRWNIAYFKSVEEVLLNGVWTPHLHLVWVFSPGTPVTAVSDFIDLISVKWRLLASMERSARPHVRTIWSQELDYKRGVATLARYLTKAFYWEQAKLGDKLHLVKPLDYAVHFANTADLDALDLWNSYEQASNGLHRFKFSKNWDFDC